MIVLRDMVEIDVSPQQIFEFFVHFRENFYAWHPDHVECRYLTSGPLKEGSVIYIEEILHGKLHKLKLRITRIEPNSRIEYRAAFGTKGVFIIEPQGDGSLFTAEMHMGTGIPLLGGLVDTILRRLPLEGIERHMVEEGQNLKEILERRSQ